MALDVRQHLERARRAIQSDTWHASDHGGGERHRTRRTLRLIVLSVRGFFRHHGLMHASALAFDTLLALVPLLAIVFSVLKGLGSYDAFVRGTVHPWLQRTFGGSVGDASLRRAFDAILDLGGHVNVTGLGLVGIVTLLYLVALLLGTVEGTLNEVFGVERARTIARKIADYTTILVVLPLALFLATAAGGLPTNVPWLGPLGPYAPDVIAVAAAAGGLTFLYAVLPHTRVRLRSAILGGVVGGALWYSTLVLYAKFQIGAARYHLLYSSLAAIPLFLVFLYVSWVMILLGAEVAAAHLDPEGFAWRTRFREPSASQRRVVALWAILEIQATFERGDVPKTVRRLAEAARVPAPWLESILDILVDAGLLIRTELRRETAYVPARELATVHVGSVIDLLDRWPDHRAFDPEAPLSRRVAGWVDRVLGFAAPQGLTVADLLAEAHSEPVDPPDDLEVAPPQNPPS